MKGKRLTPIFALKFLQDYENITLDLIKEYGETFALKGLFNNIHFLCEPKMIEHVLNNNQSNYLQHDNPMYAPLYHNAGMTRVEWLQYFERFRSKTLNLLFTNQALLPLTEALYQNSCEHFNKFDSFAKNGTTFDILDELNTLASHNLLKLLLNNPDIDIAELLKNNHAFVNQTIKYEAAITKLPWILPTATKREATRIYQKIVKFCDIAIKNGLSENSQGMNPFKAVLNAEGKNIADMSPEKDPKTWNKMRGVAAIYILAGSDSVGTNLSIVLTFLAKFPHVAEKIRETVNKNIGDGPITSENINSLSYIRCVLFESLRYSGNALLPMLARDVLDNDSINGYPVKKNDKVLIPIFYACKNQKYWNNANTFEPERFLNIDVNSDLYRYVYLVFSAGPHKCLGRHFAMLENTIILAELSRRYRLEFLPNQVLANFWKEKNPALNVRIQKI